LLIVAAPTKRPYIWDLAPSVSAVMLPAKACVYLRMGAGGGRKIAAWTSTQSHIECMAMITRSRGQGYTSWSLAQGTLAAIFNA
jgi:hypothetical protein